MRKKNNPGTLYHWLYLNYVLGGIAMVMLYIYRFDEIGRTCSGDFLDQYPQMPFNGIVLEEIGLFLKILAAYVFVGPPVVGIVLLILILLKIFKIDITKFAI